MAIAFDTSADNGSLVGPSTTITTSHTCTGSNLILFAGFFGNTTDTVTGVTYAGAAMTQVNKVLCVGDRWIYLYYLINPATGANNIVATSSLSSLWRMLSCSYTGVKQSAQPDAQTTNSVLASTSITTSVTTIADNCWTIVIAKTGTGDPSAGTGATSRQIASGNGLGIFDSNGAITPPASSSMTINSSASNDATVMASFSPFVSAGVTPGSTAMMMGI